MQFSSEKFLRPICTRIIEFEKHQGTFFKGTPGFARVILQAIRSFPKNLRG